MGLLRPGNPCKVVLMIKNKTHFIFTLSLALGLFVLLFNPAHASADLAKKSTCSGCHAVDRKVVGPSYKAIAARYQNQPRAQVIEAMATKIRLGGSGAWGVVVMPANTKLSEANAKVLAEWIMDGAK